MSTVETSVTPNVYRTADPWLYATVSSPDTSVPSTPEMPIALHDSEHTNDLFIDNNIDKSIAAVQEQGFAAIKGFLTQWRPQ